MKKFFLYLILFIAICFIFPIICTRQNKMVKTQETVTVENIAETDINKTNSSVTSTEENNSKDNEEYKYNKYSTVKLLHSKTQEVEEISLDNYIANVVSAEMPANFELEALKAQTVVARTYTLYKIANKKHENADICDDYNCCQAWISKEDRMNKWEEKVRETNWNKISQAVKETEGKVIVYEGKPINAFFHSNSGGTTEVPVNVWGGTGYPYLQTVQTSRRRWVFTI